MKFLRFTAVNLVLELDIGGLGFLRAESRGGVAGSLEGQRGEIGASADAVGATEGSVGEFVEARWLRGFGRRAPGGGVHGNVGRVERCHGDCVAEATRSLRQMHRRHGLGSWVRKRREVKAHNP